MRTPQQWYFLAPEIKQAFHPALDQDSYMYRYNLQMSNMLFGSKGRFDAWSLLAKPVSPGFSNPTQSGSLGALDVLSNELLDMIIADLDEKSDIIALGFSCEGFWQIISRHIQGSYIKAAAPWAGTKIAFQGSYCYDLPKPFLEDGLLDYIVPDQYQGSRSWGRFRQFYWAHAEFCSPIGTKDHALAWLDAAELYREDSGISLDRWDQIKKEIECGEVFPQDRTWLLRNLTTREIVSSKVFETVKLRSGKGRNEMKFEDVLIMKICWTSHASHGDEHLGIHRGVWAGHRFDIVTSEIHSLEAGLDKWRDITSKIAGELAALKTKLQR
jgi:hypothetical protein